MHFILYLSAALFALSAKPAETQLVPATVVAESAKGALMQKLHDSPTIQIDISGRIADQVLPAGVLRIELGKIAGRWPRSRAGIPIRLLVNEQLVRTLTVWVQTTDQREVPTYEQAYASHTPTNLIRLVAARVDMSCCEGSALEQKAPGSGRRLLRSVHAGQPALGSDFEVTPDVVAQQHVTIEVVHGPVRLTIGGVALRDARIGERVDVRTDITRDAISSTVVASNSVVVQ